MNKLFTELFASKELDVDVDVVICVFRKQIEVRLII